MMQFNPLFLNDIKGSQSTNNSSGKLQKNQYLFSDIIKVVMKDNGDEENMTKLSQDDQTKETEIIGGNFVQVSEQLQNITITDDDNEKMKVKLADILPEDMAKLLTTDENKSNSEQIVSYIGKEQLQGELKNFLTGLVGEKVFKEHVSDESGVLLKLEDAKSSVNIEITKEINNSSKENKTMVHALIVPQKSKLELLSKQNDLLAGIKNNNLIKNSIDPAKLEQLEKEFNNNILGKIFVSSDDNNSKSAKPTLSVFAFKVNNKNESASMLSEKLKALVKKNENELENIIRTTKFLKTETKTEENSKGTITKEKNISDTKSLKTKVTKGNLFETNKVKTENNSATQTKDFNISKITIIKKQDSPNVNNISAGKKQNENVKNVTFEINKNSEKPLETIDNKDVLKPLKMEKDLVKNDLKVKVNNVAKETPKAEKQTLENKVSNFTTAKNDNSINEILKEPEGKNNSFNTKDNSVQIKDNNPQLKNRITNKESLVLNNTKVNEQDNNNESSIDKNQSVDKNVGKDVNKVDLKDVDKTLSKNKEMVAKEKNTKPTESIRKNDTQTKISNEAKLVNENTVHKSVPDNNTKIIEENKNNTSNVHKNLTAVNEAIVDNAAKNLMPNKKVSVKVKKVVKSVNNKNEQESNISKEIRLEQNEEKKGNNSDLNHSKDSQNLKNPDLDIHTKKKLDTAFHHIMHKEVGTKINETGITPQDIPQQNSEKIVKSIEVIKEISRFISLRKKGSLSFTIKPEHLGHLKITLETTNHLLNAHIQVENEQAKLLVEKNLNQLHTQLQDSGVELNSLNISLGYSSKQDESFQQESKKQLDYSEPIKEEITKDSSKTKSLGYNTYEYLA